VVCAPPCGVLRHGSGPHLRLQSSSSIRAAAVARWWEVRADCGGTN
jgi:hypothetical protein